MTRLTCKDKSAIDAVNGGLVDIHAPALGNPSNDFCARLLSARTNVNESKSSIKPHKDEYIPYNGLNLLDTLPSHINSRQESNDVDNVTHGRTLKRARSVSVPGRLEREWRYHVQSTDDASHSKQSDETQQDAQPVSLLPSTMGPANTLDQATQPVFPSILSHPKTAPGSQNTPVSPVERQRVNDTNTVSKNKSGRLPKNKSTPTCLDSDCTCISLEAYSDDKNMKLPMSPQAASNLRFCRRHWLINVARELTGTSTGSRLSVQISNIPPGSKDTVLSLASRFSRDVTGSYSELVGPVKGRTENATLSFEHSQLREAFSSDIMARVPGCTVTPVKRVQGMEVCSLLDDMSRTVCISLRGQSPEGPLKSLEMALPTLIADIVGYSVLSSSGPGERILALFTTRAKTEKALSEITCLIDRDERHAIFHVEWGTTRFQRWVEAAYNVTKRGRVQSKEQSIIHDIPLAGLVHGLHKMMYPADGMTLILNPKPSGDSATSTSHRSYPESISGVPSNATHPEQVQEAGTAQDAVCGTHHVGQASDMPKPSAIFVTAENPTTVKETFRGRNSNAHEGATAHEDTDAAVLPSAMVMKDAFPMEHRHSAVSESNLEGAQGAPVNRQRWDLCHIVETVVFEMTSGSNFTQSDAISEHFEPTEAQRDIASKLDNLVVQDMDAMMGGYQKGKRDLAIVTRIKQLAAEITRNAKYPPRHHKVPRGSVELGLTHDLHSIGEPLACVLLCHTTRCVGTDYYQVFDRMWKIASLVDEEIAVQLKSLSAPSGSAESSSGYSKTRDGIYDFINKSKRMQTSPLRRMPRHEAFRLDRWANHLAIWAVREGIIDVKRLLQIADACAWGKLHFGDPNSSYRMLEPLQRDNIKQALEPCVEFFSNLFEELCAPRISTNNAMEDPVQEYRLHMAAFLDAVAHLKVRACQATEELAHLWETIDILTDIIHEDSENDEP